MLVPDIQNPNLIITVSADVLTRTSAGLMLFTKLHIFPLKLFFLSYRRLCVWFFLFHFFCFIFFINVIKIANQTLWNLTVFSVVILHVLWCIAVFPALLTVYITELPTQQLWMHQWHIHSSRFDLGAMGRSFMLMTLLPALQHVYTADGKMASSTDEKTLWPPAQKEKFPAGAGIGK